MKSISFIPSKFHRVAVLIDVQNMYHSAKHLYQSRLNFKEAVRAAVDNRQMTRAIAYVIRTESGEEKAFLEALAKNGIETREKDLQTFPGGVKKADWDVGIAMDAVKIGNRLDALIVMSGDGDFVPLIEYLHEVYGIRVEVAAFSRSASQRLREAADSFLDLGADRKKFLIPIR
ncbi:MAG: NYN domain-containing protein [Candidatus Sungbacteria bacterium]|nr:NYN domain-containing protein [Candidatus Sungbacteria bacterium]